MNRVSYLVKKNGLKGSIKVSYYEDAVAKAKQIGGYIKTVYTKVDEKPMSWEDIERRDKRIAHFRAKAVSNS